MKYSMALLMALAIGGVIAWFVLFMKMYMWLGEMTGIEQCLWAAIPPMIAVAVDLARGKPLWVMGTALTYIQLLAWGAYITHQEYAHQLLVKSIMHVMLAIALIGMARTWAVARQLDC